MPAQKVMLIVGRNSMTTIQTAQKPLVGLTLIEVLVAIAILAILLSIGAPSFQKMMDNRRLIGATEGILSVLRYAATEGTKGSQPVTLICTSGANWTCGATWGSGDSRNRSVTHEEFPSTTLVIESSVGQSLLLEPRKLQLIRTSNTVITTDSQWLTISSQLGNITILATPSGHFMACASEAIGGYPKCPD